MRKNEPSLTNENLSNARKLLFAITELLDNKGIPYHLEGGTLLGIVRDHDLLPWIMMWIYQYPPNIHQTY